MRVKMNLPDQPITCDLTCIWSIEPRGIEAILNIGVASLPVKMRRDLAIPSRHNKSYLHAL